MTHDDLIEEAAELVAFILGEDDVYPDRAVDINLDKPPQETDWSTMLDRALQFRRHHKRFKQQQHHEPGRYVLGATAPWEK